MASRRPCAVSNHGGERPHPSNAAQRRFPVTASLRMLKSPKMSKSPPAPPSLEVLRKEIDSIDEQVHRLLMARGDIIDRLI